MIRLMYDIDPSRKSPKNREPLAGAVYASLNRPHNADPLARTFARLFGNL
jgi:hypothetical protein